VLRGRPSRAAIAAGIAAAVALAAAPGASGSEYSKSLARKIGSEIVYVDPKAKPRVSTSEAGQIRIRIVKKAFGRLKIGVVPEDRAADEGGASGLAAAVGRDLEFRGTLLIVAGSNVYALTSHPASGPTAQAVDEAFRRHDDRGDQLLAAVNAVGAVDPGPSADVQRPRPGGGSTPGAPGFDGSGEDFIDDIGDAIKLTTFIIGAAIALPFIAVFLWLLLRFRRGRKEQEEDWDYAREQLRNELITLGDEIRALDVDTSMPGANALGIADYEAALAQYDRANMALDRADENPRLRVAEARAALKEGKRRMSDAKVRLGVTPIP
jgi:hypothetical protein